ncbi:hypothetical protein [Mangrovimonas cancribranchiae]|uniref:SGNH/GDSL hydrolase family protein n=1 Tax=Mangrovimonas cancribranchiae TaxID=3080055 RepID=A0AAU6P1C1_9FLAO
MSKRGQFKLPTSIKYVMFGHSHAECAYNDSVISNFKNLSSSGESYFYTYFKIKQIIEHNPHLTLILVEFSNNQIMSDMDDWVWDDKHLSNGYSKWGTFMGLSAHKLLMRNNPESILFNMAYSQKLNLYRILNNDFNFVDNMGGYRYLPSKNSNLNVTKRMDSIRKHRDIKKVSHVNLIYLKKIVKLCEQSNIKIAFVRSPQHNNNIARDNECVFLTVKNQRFKGVSFIDFNNLELSDNMFKDLGHLNYLGANIVSKKLDSILKSRIPNNDIIF